jgi:hypothetical protein
MGPISIHLFELDDFQDFQIKPSIGPEYDFDERSANPA